MSGFVKVPSPNGSYDDDQDSSICGFCVSFTWDYPDNWCLKDVKDNIFHTVDNKNASRSESQFVSKCIQQSASGVILSQANPYEEKIPCELTLSKAEDIEVTYVITKILIVSEAKHMELYVNHLYAKTSKGCMVMARKGKKAALYENEFDLSGSGRIDNIKVKFLSLAEDYSMRLQTVILWIIPATSKTKAVPNEQLDLSNIKDMVKSIGLLVNEMDQRKQNEQAENDQKPQPVNKKSQMDVLQHLMQLTGIASLNTKNIVNQEIHQQQLEVDATSETNNNHTNDKDFGLVSPMTSFNDEFNDDAFDGYGTPNPPNESILANAILNEEASRKISESRASVIEEQNIEQAQIEFVNVLNKDQQESYQNSVVPSVTVQNGPQKPPRKLTVDRSKRPVSLGALPNSTSEADFTKLLSDLMRESNENLENGRKEDHTSRRWEAYLRSRVRASQRLATKSLSRPASIPSNMPGESNGKQQYFTLREKQPWSQSLHRIQHTGLSRSSSMNYGSTKDYPVGRSTPDEPCKSCSNLLSVIDITIKESENRIMNHIDEKFVDFKNDVYRHLNELHKTIITSQEHRRRDISGLNDFERHSPNSPTSNRNSVYTNTAHSEAHLHNDALYSRYPETYNGDDLFKPSSYSGDNIPYRNGTRQSNLSYRNSAEPDAIIYKTRNSTHSSVV